MLENDRESLCVRGREGKVGGVPVSVEHLVCVSSISMKDEPVLDLDGWAFLLKRRDTKDMLFFFLILGGRDRALELLRGRGWDGGDKDTGWEYDVAVWGRPSVRREGEG